MAKKARGYTHKQKDEITTAVCDRISAGETLRKVSEDMMVSRVHFMEWVDSDDEWRSRYARAKEIQADYYADRIIEASQSDDDPNRVRVQVDAYKWIASKLKPKSWGDKLQVESDTSVTVVIQDSFNEGKQEVKGEK